MPNTPYVAPRRNNSSSKTKIRFPDIFGKPIGFLFDERQYYPTCCGYIGTVVVVLVVTMAMIGEGSKMLSQDLISLEYYESRSKSVRDPSFYESLFGDNVSPLDSQIEIIVVSPPNSLKFGTHLQLVSPGNQVSTVDCPSSKFWE